MNVPQFTAGLAALRLQVEEAKTAATELCNDAPDMFIASRASYVMDRMDIVLKEIDEVAEYAAGHYRKTPSISDNVTLQK
jgi:hypothetical protein